MISSFFSFVIFIVPLPKQNEQVLDGSSRGIYPTPKQRGHIPLNIAVSSILINEFIKYLLTIHSTRPSGLIHCYDMQINTKEVIYDYRNKY